jgi:hypothetical protein
VASSRYHSSAVRHCNVWVSVTLQSFIKITKKCSDIGTHDRQYKIEIAVPKNLIEVINSGKACYRPVQSLPFCLLSKNVNIKLYNTIILYVILYGCETWSLTLRKGHTLSKFENGALGRIFGPRRK